MCEFQADFYFCLALQSHTISIAQIPFYVNREFHKIVQENFIPPEYFVHVAQNGVVAFLYFTAFAVGETVSVSRGRQVAAPMGLYGIY